MRRLMIGGVRRGHGRCLAACTSSSCDSETKQKLQQTADRWEIDQIEKNFHEATTKKDIDLMLSLWAPNATLTVGPGKTAAGMDEIRRFWLEKSAAFSPRPLGLGPPRLQARDHGQRRPGHAALRVPLRRITTSDKWRRRHGRRSRRRADRRTVADHQHGWRIDRSGSLSLVRAKPNGREGPPSPSGAGR